ncbi:MAG: 1-deoxy-D-xylulose-5-phosphate reductoisomerase [Erysipelotrichaceae bacterium]|nr:1-deoxy-D-xylulose-5-phosphate reductoisomerase [Erysipelotrichaceae bacterium]
MKKILLLGCSGSIGKQTIDIIKEHKDSLQLVGVSVYNNVDYLKELLAEFDIKFAYLKNYNEELNNLYPNTKFFYGDNGLEEIVKEDYDLLVNALVGFVGFVPTLNAINANKDIALANKETLVAGGQIIMKAIKEKGVKLFPIDSEHSAILQCLQGHNKKDVKKLIITASGGSFRDKRRDELENVTLEDALHHPNWSMGSKITIDSATMMNKGFEIIEAHYLFDIPFDKIEPVLHYSSIVHSMVEYEDGSVIAQMSNPDMHLPIRYALLFPNNLKDENSQYLDFSKMLNLDFRPVDYGRYPLVKLAKEVGSLEGSFGAILIGANDEAVSLFLNRHIKFMEIEEYIFDTLKHAHFIQNPNVKDIIEANRWAKDYVKNRWANK